MNINLALKGLFMDYVTDAEIYFKLSQRGLCDAIYERGNLFL